MTALAVGTTVLVLSIIGLVVGLIVLLVVIALLQATLSPLRKVLASVRLAQGEPMFQRGVPGTDQLGQTRRLAESVPDLALAYLGKLSRGAPAAPPAPAAAPAAPPAAPPFSPAAPAAPAPAQGERVPEPPAWKKFLA